MKFIWIVWLSAVHWTSLCAQVNFTHHLQLDPLGLLRKSDREIHLRYQQTLEGGLPFNFSAKYTFPETRPRLAEGTSVQEYTEVVNEGFLIVFFAPIIFDGTPSYPGNRPWEPLPQLGYDRGSVFLSGGPQFFVAKKKVPHRGLYFSPELVLGLQRYWEYDLDLKQQLLSREVDGSSGPPHILFVDGLTTTTTTSTYRQTRHLDISPRMAGVLGLLCTAGVRVRLGQRLTLDASVTVGGLAALEGGHLDYGRGTSPPFYRRASLLVGYSF